MSFVFTLGRHLAAVLFISHSFTMGRLMILHNLGEYVLVGVGYNNKWN